MKPECPARQRRNRGDSDGDGLRTPRGIGGDFAFAVLTPMATDSLTCWKFVRATPGSIRCSRAMRLPHGTDRLDDDGDGLLNCERALILARIPPDRIRRGRIPDDLEVRMGTNPRPMTSSTTRISMGHATAPSCKPHTDSPVQRRGQFLGHCLPLQHKPAARPERPARGVCATASRSSNITLAPTLAALDCPRGPTPSSSGGIGAADSPEDFGNHQVACVRPNYRWDPEVKTPSSGQMAAAD